MKSLKTPLGIFAILYLIYGIIMNIRMFTQKMWPTYLFFISMIIGILFLFLNKPTKQLKNYKFWQIIIGIIPVTFFFVYMQIVNIKYDTNVQNITNENVSSLKKGIKKIEFSKYQGSELSVFYKDFEKEITEIVWNDEPPAKLSGVTFVINEKKYYDIELDSIPKLFKMNLNMNWKMNEVGNSKIRNIKLIEENNE